MTESAKSPSRTRSSKPSLVLVTGASGHLGANLVRSLLDDGLRVRVTTRTTSNNQALDGLDVEIVSADLRDPSSIDAAVAGCSHIYHCAAKLSTFTAGRNEKLEVFESNVVGTQNILRAALKHKVQRVVVTGSLSGTGYDPRQPSRPCSESWPFFPFDDPMPYEMSKALVELECHKAYADGLNVVIATSCAIIGPNDFKPSRMGRVLCDFATGKLKAYVPGGFEFVATRDIVSGHRLAMEKGRAGQKYIFSSGFMTMDQLMQHFEEVTGTPKPRLRLPPHLIEGAAEVVYHVKNTFFPKAPQQLTPGAIRILRLERHVDCRKAKEELGFKPSNMRTAIEEAYQDFVRRGIIPARKPSLKQSLMQNLQKRAESIRPKAMQSKPTNGRDKSKPVIHTSQFESAKHAVN